MQMVKSTKYGNMAGMYNIITAIISLGGNKRSQKYFLKFIKNKPEILNVGCGSVSFSTILSKQCLNVTSLDISKRMIDKTEKNVTTKGDKNNIVFVCSDIMEYKPDKKFDIVFANFFLNTFEWNDCKKVISHIISLIKDDGYLCIADEVIGKKTITRINQFFFRPLFTWIHYKLANHPLHPIYDYSKYIKEHNMKLIEEKRDITDYIESKVYRKIILKQ